MAVDWAMSLGFGMKISPGEFSFSACIFFMRNRPTPTLRSLVLPCALLCLAFSRMERPPLKSIDLP